MFNPVGLDYFERIGTPLLEGPPVRARDLVWLFCIRTALLIPPLAFLTHALVAAGVLVWGTG